MVNEQVFDFILSVKKSYPDYKSADIISLLEASIRVLNVIEKPATKSIVRTRKKKEVKQNVADDVGF